MRYFLSIALLLLLSGPVFAVPLTQEQRDILAYIVVDPEAWNANNEATARDEAEATKRLEAKVQKWKPIFEAEKARLGVKYKNRAARDLDVLIFQPPVLTNKEILDEALRNSVFKALVKTLAKQFNVTEAQFKATIQHEME